MGTTGRSAADTRFRRRRRQGTNSKEEIRGELTMKKLSVVLGTLLILSAAVFGETLAQTDREKGIKYLEQTRDGVVQATKGLSDAQMTFKSGPDRWSVAETLEHIATAEG